MNCFHFVSTCLLLKVLKMKTSCLITSRGFVPLNGWFDLCIAVVFVSVSAVLLLEVLGSCSIWQSVVLQTSLGTHLPFSNAVAFFSILTILFNWCGTSVVGSVSCFACCPLGVHFSFVWPLTGRLSRLSFCWSGTSWLRFVFGTHMWYAPSNSLALKGPP